MAFPLLGIELIVPRKEEIRRQIQNIIEEIESVNGSEKGFILPILN